MNANVKKASSMDTPSISIEHEIVSGASLIASAPIEVQNRFLSELDEETLLALPFLFDFWALPHQLPPEGDWRTWVILGGRGAGKTRAGAEWIRSQVEGAKPTDGGAARSVALVGDTIEQAREVMVFGDSGIMACTPPDRKPTWEATRKRLVWPNGAVAMLYSAHDPESLRGPQFDAAWLDELAKWKRGEEAWDMLQFGLRLGNDPRQCVTTTPRNVGVLKRILAMPSTEVTHAPTEANSANLSRSFVEEVRARYAGTFLGRQELDGVLLDDLEGALWTTEMLDTSRRDDLLDLHRIVVAIDPPTTGHMASDACGIVVAGVDMKGKPSEWRVQVLEDASVAAASPLEWAEAAVEAYHRHEADRVVAEVNQGGDLVETVIRQVDAGVPFRAVRASRGKVARAEPVAALYEQGRVHHVAGLTALEDQMRLLTMRGFQGAGSPDRVDALVWAVHDLLIEPAASMRRPQVRTLM
jgi:phage terminase large subunit-like protein